MDGLIKALVWQTHTPKYSRTLAKLPAPPPVARMSFSVWVASVLLGWTVQFMAGPPCHSSPKGAGCQEAHLHGSSQAGLPAGTIYDTRALTPASSQAASTVGAGRRQPPSLSSQACSLILCIRSCVDQTLHICYSTLTGLEITAPGKGPNQKQHHRDARWSHPGCLWIASHEP